MNLNYFFRDGWPLFENVDRPHPFIAYKVQNAVISLPASALEEIKALFSSKKILQDARIASPKGHSDYNKEIKKIVKNLKEVDLKDKIDEAHSVYRKQAKEYLQEQIGYAAQGTATTDYPLLYDPVGTCFALQTLLRHFVVESKVSDLQKAIGEYKYLISRSIQHILEALTTSGSFPYGVPFSYNTNGTAGFTTSTNGLSAITLFLRNLLYYARKSDYPSEDLLEQLLLDNYQHFVKLLKLLPLFKSNIRIRSISTEHLKEGIRLRGWSTDRAPNESRIESWVTIEVLRFAIYLREILQEYAQFFICRNYAARLMNGEPVWPYSSSEPVTKVDKQELIKSGHPAKTSILIDPDETASHSATPVFAESNNCPVQFLHKKFKRFMKDAGNNLTDWNQDVSSILLFGPPGTAKTATVKSLAQALGWHYLELSPSNFVIDGLEKIEQKAKVIFEELGLLRETVILFDELDSLFIDREFLKPDSIINFIVPAMLPKLQGLSKRAKKQRVLIVIATNFYDRLDPAMVRLGRIDKHLLALPYNDISRLGLLLSDIDKTALDDKLTKQLTANSRLYVYEEVAAIKKLVEEGVPLKDIKYSASAISPAIYRSRISNAESSRKLSTQRLGFEICEVAGRFLNEERNLTPEASIKELIERLGEMEKQLSDKNSEEWSSLCKAVRLALDENKASKKPGAS